MKMKRHLLIRWFSLVALVFITRAGARAELRLAGFTEPSKYIKVAAPESGILTEVLVKEGDKVKKGQVVARLDSRVVESDLAVAKEELERLTIRFDKLSQLEKSHDAAPEEIERAKSELTIQRLRVKRFETMIENFTVHSPIEGVVTELKTEAAESVAAGSSHLMTIVDVERLWVNLQLPVQQAEKFKQGEPVNLYFFDEKRNAPARVEFISPLADPATGTKRVKFEIDNRSGEYRSGVRCGLAPVEAPAAKVPRNTP